MVVLLTAAVIVAAAVIAAAWWIAGAIDRRTDSAAKARAVALVSLFGPGLADAERDPRALLVWQPLARTVRRLDAEVFAAVDKAAGGAFPFGAERIQAAHAKWTADWLAWEARHDAEYKQKATEAVEEIARAGGSASARGRLDAIEREKLERYQQRYAEYVQVAKALQALIE
jgi:hypothetical protein